MAFCAQSVPCFSKKPENRVFLMGILLLDEERKDMEEEKKGKRNVSLEEAAKLIRGQTKGIPAVVLPLAEVNGEILCGDIPAIHDRPPFPRSRIWMDMRSAERTAEGQRGSIRSL